MFYFILVHCIVRTIKLIPIMDNSVSTTIQNALTFGGGFTLHAEYQLNVTVGNNSWIVYRRYKEFERLHKDLTAMYPKPIHSSTNDIQHEFDANEEKDDLPSLKFPEKSYWGSYLSASSSTTQERKMVLQEFLETICNTPRLRESMHFTQFVDLQCKGQSGIAKFCGQDNILKETFTNCKVVKNYIGSWSVCYLVLMKDGTLYVLRSIYDSPDKSLVKWNLKGGEIRVVPKAKNNTISISSTVDDRKLHLGLNSPSEAAFWIRTISDLSLEHPQHPPQKIQTTNKVPTTQPSKTPTVVVRAQGTGNTADELSSMYGI